MRTTSANLSAVVARGATFGEKRGSYVRSGNGRFVLAIDFPVLPVTP